MTSTSTSTTTTTAAPAEELAVAGAGPQPVPFLRGAWVVFDLSLEAMLWSRRTLAMCLIYLVPLLMGLAYRLVLAAGGRVGFTPPDFYGIIAAYYYIWFALPLTALFYATALVADEVEARTITYLLTRPVKRLSILAGKFAAYLATTLALALPALVLTFLLLLTHMGRRGLALGLPDLLRDLGVAALALLTYGAFFTLIGVMLRWPLITGLLFIYGWEWLSIVPGYFPRVTIRAWLASLHRHVVAGEGISEAVAQGLPLVPGLITLGVFSLLCLVLAGWIFAQRQYVLDQ